MAVATSGSFVGLGSIILTNAVFGAVPCAHHQLHVAATTEDFHCCVIVSGAQVEKLGPSHHFAFLTARWFQAGHQGAANVPIFFPCQHRSCLGGLQWLVCYCSLRTREVHPLHVVVLWLVARILDMYALAVEGCMGQPILPLRLDPQQFTIMKVEETAEEIDRVTPILFLVFPVWEFLPKVLSIQTWQCVHEPPMAGTTQMALRTPRQLVEERLFMMTGHISEILRGIHRHQWVSMDILGAPTPAWMG
jgi:hypothetical protein